MLVEVLPGQQMLCPALPSTSKVRSCTRRSSLLPPGFPYQLCHLHSSTFSLKKSHPDVLPCLSDAKIQICVSLLSSTMTHLLVLDETLKHMYNPSRTVELYRHLHLEKHSIEITIQNKIPEKRKESSAITRTEGLILPT